LLYRNKAEKVKGGNGFKPRLLYIHYTYLKIFFGRTLPAPLSYENILFFYLL